MDSNYENECLAIRLISATNSTDSKLKNSAYKRLLEVSNQLGWTSFLEELIRTIKTDLNLSSILSGSIINIKSETSKLTLDEELNGFFQKMVPKEAPSKSLKIREYAILYYNIGNFSQYLMVFSRYIKFMKDIPADEMNSLIYKFFISCLMKRNYELGISEITFLMPLYQQYDMKIYIYLIRLITGCFTEASECVLNISQNIYPEAIGLLNESDFGFYSTLTLLINFKRNFLREIQSDAKTIIYKIHEDNANNFEILEYYSKCRFDAVSTELDKLKERIVSDPILTGNAVKIYIELKNNMIKEILRACSSVSINYLSNILKESEDKIENMILYGIRNNTMKACIDDIDHIVYSREPDTKNILITKTLTVAKEIYNDSISKLTDKLIMKNVENISDELDNDSLKFFKAETKNYRTEMFNI